MTQINLGKYLLTVDTVTYNNLQDPDFARQYLAELERQFGHDNPKTTLIWSLKKPTELDIMATTVFLELRSNLNEEFMNKKTNKNQLWLQIATKLNSMGYHVGEGVAGREKCRQKFMNLQATFFKYRDQIRQTGEGFVKKPPFYDDLEVILGNSDKASPAIIFDSSFPPSESPILPCSSEQSYTLEKSSSLGQPSSIKSPCSVPRSPKETRQIEKLQNNRFKVKKSIRPRRTVLTTVENIITEERTLRQQQFAELLEAVKQQNEQRHQQTMGMIELLKQRKDNENK